MTLFMKICHIRQTRLRIRFTIPRRPVDHEPVLYLHWHHEMEFLVLVQGEITVHMEDRSYVLQAGDGIFIPHGLLHYANSRSEIPPAFYAFVLFADVLVPRV